MGVDVVSLKKESVRLYRFVYRCRSGANWYNWLCRLYRATYSTLVNRPDHRYLLPASMLGGAILLCLADLLARTLILPSELPIGLITSALGGPFFLIMLVKTYRLKEL